MRGEAPKTRDKGSQTSTVNGRYVNSELDEPKLLAFPSTKPGFRATPSRSPIEAVPSWRMVCLWCGLTDVQKAMDRAREALARMRG
jgi:hypothetical protein